MSKTLCSPTRQCSGGVTYFKAVQPDGTDFYTGTVQWVPESGIPTEGFTVNHPTSTEWGERHSTHLCASTSPTGCEGFRWPCRLLEVEPASGVHEHDGTKVSALAWRVVRELPATQALGPQGAAVAALIDGLRLLDAESLARLADAAWNAAQDEARYYAWNAVQDAARIAAGDAAWDAVLASARFTAWDVAVALVVWDLIDPAHRNILTAPIRTALPDLWAEVSANLPEGVTSGLQFDPATRLC